MNRNNTEVTEAAVAERLRGMIKALDIDNSAFGELVGASASLVSNWVRAKHLPRVPTMSKLCQMEGVSLDWVYRGVVVTPKDSLFADWISAQRAVRSKGPQRL